MIEERSIDTPTNDILNKLNYLNSCKNSGIDSGNVFPTIVSRVGDLIANKISNNMLSDEEIESLRTYILKDADMYFSSKGLSVAFKSLEESINMAEYDREEKSKTGFKLWKS